MKSQKTRRFFSMVSGRFSDFFRGGNQVFDMITVWMNVFCGLYCYSYWRVIELSKLGPPREMTVGVVAIVLLYIAGDKLLAKAYLKASAGGYDSPPAQAITTENVNAPVTGDGANITLTTAASDITGQSDPGAH